MKSAIQVDKKIYFKASHFFCLCTVCEYKGINHCVETLKQKEEICFKILREKWTKISMLIKLKSDNWIFHYKDLNLFKSEFIKDHSNLT